MLKMMPALALGSTLLLSGVAVAQQNQAQPPTRPDQQNERETRRVGERREGHDQMFAQCLAIDNAVEIQISEFAAQRLQNEQVKQFAKMMVEDHRAFLKKLEQHGAQPVSFTKEAGRETTAAPAANADVTVRTGREGAQVDVNRDDQPAEGRQRVREEVRERVTERREGRQVDFLSIKQEIAQECVRSAEDELSSKSGAEADKCFMAAQVFGHQHMLTALKVFERHASPEFKETLAQASQTTQKHLDEAKQILKTLDNTSSETPAASSGTTP